MTDTHVVSALKGTRIEVTNRIKSLSHFIFRSNQADILREMSAFMDSLPQ